MAGELVGVCIDGVCIEPGCGNGVVEPGELCDDGNRANGDGCGADCNSREACGDGVVNSALDEVCDDGNLVSHDGCDSRCQPEQVSWHAHAIWTRSTDGAYDEVHGRFVIVIDNTMTWTWDGSRWDIVFVGPQPYGGQLVWDPDRLRVIAFGRTSGGWVVNEWDGTSWTPRATTGTPPTGYPVRAVYDRTRHATLVLLSNPDQVVYLDSASGSWAAAPALPIATTAIGAIAYDAARARVVALQPGFKQDTGPPVYPSTWELDGATWTEHPQISPRAWAGWVVTFDAMAGQVVAIGGSTTTEFSCVDCDPTYELDGGVFAWDGTTWNERLTSSIPPQLLPGCGWYDPVSRSLWAWVGEAIFEIVPNTTTNRAPVHPPAIGPTVYDARHDRFVMLRSTTPYVYSPYETWAWSSQGWLLLGTSTGGGGDPARPGAMAYDPARGGVLVIDQNDGSLWLFDGSWLRLFTLTTPQNTVRDMVYDFDQQRMIFSADQTYALPSDATAWAAIAPSAPGGAIAFDLTNHRLLGLDEATGTLHELIGTTWQQTLSPGADFTLVADVQRGSVLLLPSGSQSVNRPAWERRGASWTEVEAPPHVFTANHDTVADARRGTTTLFASFASTSMILERELGSGLADESCVAGEDLDGDGASGCDDRDCWMTCAPECAPVMSCP
jgi:cysteine-rich repeat protein